MKGKDVVASILGGNGGMFSGERMLTCWISIPPRAASLSKESGCTSEFSWPSAGFVPFWSYSENLDKGNQSLLEFQTLKVF